MKTKSLHKFTLEYRFNVSPRMLYSMLSTSEGLSVWFADRVVSANNHFQFFWDEEENTAELTHIKEFENLRFEWIKGESDKYFEFHINSDSIDNETTLLITDFAEEADLHEAEMSWDFSVNKLLRALGSKISNLGN